MQSKLRLLHLSDLLRSAAARGSSCLKLKSCSQSFLGEDDCQRLQRLVGCSSVVTGNSFHKVHHVTARVELGKEQKRHIQTHRQFCFVLETVFTKFISQSDKLGKEKTKTKKKRQKTLACCGDPVFVLVLSICICICIINLYLYLSL